MYFENRTLTEKDDEKLRKLLPIHLSSFRRPFKWKVDSFWIRWIL